MSIFELLEGQLGQTEVHEISQKVGAEPGAVQSVLQAGLPLLMSGLAKNAAKPDGAQSILSALDRDHDGGVLDDVTGFLGQVDPQVGQGILGHVLGRQTGQVEQQLGNRAGVDPGSVGQILSMVAPLVMGALGKQKRERDLDAGGLATMLEGERQQAMKKRPEAQSMISSLLDRDGDGSMVDDVAEMGLNALSGFLKGRKR